MHGNCIYLLEFNEIPTVTPGITFLIDMISQRFHLVPSCANLKYRRANESDAKDTRSLMQTQLVSRAFFKHFVQPIIDRREGSLLMSRFIPSARHCLISDCVFLFQQLLKKWMCYLIFAYTVFVHAFGWILRMKVTLRFSQDAIETTCFGSWCLYRFEKGLRRDLLRETF